VASYELWLGGDRFRAEVSDGRFEIERGPRTGARRSSRPFSARWPSSSTRAVSRGGAPLRDVSIEDDRRAVERFLRIFPLPEPTPTSTRT
jgi:hypothetical protein